VKADRARLAAAFSAPTSVSLAGRAAGEQPRLVGASADDPGLTELSARMRAAHGDAARPFAAWGWDAAGLVLAAVRKAGSSNPQRVRDALEQVTGYRAIAGQVDMDRRTHRLSPLPVAIMRILDGAPVTSEPRYMARAAARTP
jgi:branched-chain amino acid transport system substrate-binding protein